MAILSSCVLSLVIMASLYLYIQIGILFLLLLIRMKISIEEQLDGKVVNETRFQIDMSALGISIINARSPQAKGRIERLWNTFRTGSRQN